MSLISVSCIGMQLEPVQKAVVHDQYESVFNPPQQEQKNVEARRSSDNLGGGRPIVEQPGQLVNEDELQ